jgi:hypothetical protein
VIWGLRTQRHTHRYIHHHFHRTLEKLGLPVLWVEDSARNAGSISGDDLVISVGTAGTHLPIVADAYYCLHNFEGSFHERIASNHNIRLQVYTNGASLLAEKWDTATFFHRPTRTLFQPWGTDLFAEEFEKPTFRRWPFVFWIGTVWDNSLHQGNRREINRLKAALKPHGLRFVALRHIPDRINVFAVRHSRIAPAIGGQWQVENGYLPCRMFKNISYGQLGMSNISEFHEILGDSGLLGNDIGDLVEKALALSESEYKQRVLEQQAHIVNHTYVNKLLNISRAFEACD